MYSIELIKTVLKIPILIQLKKTILTTILQIKFNPNTKEDLVSSTFLIGDNQMKSLKRREISKI